MTFRGGLVSKYKLGNKCWKLGREQRRYYMSAQKVPLCYDGHLQGLRRTEGGLNLMEGLIAFIKQCLPGSLIE